MDRDQRGHEEECRQSEEERRDEIPIQREDRKTYMQLVLALVHVNAPADAHSNKDSAQH